MSTIINGHDLRVYVGGTAVAKATDCSFSMAIAMREISHKDTAGSSGGFKEVSPGQKSGTMTTSALYAEGESFEALFAAADAGTSLALLFSDGVAGNLGMVANGFITSLDLNATDNENVSYSVSFEISGAITRVANS